MSLELVPPEACELSLTSPLFHASLLASGALLEIFGVLWLVEA